jgi:gamma-polyglutamate biosynthesis protein CapA
MKNTTRISVGFAGDVAFTGYFAKNLELNKRIFDKPLNSYLRKNNFNVVNFEGPICISNKIKTKGIPVINSSNACEYLKDNNITICNLANNHIMDCGVEGLKNTIDILNENDMSYFGAGITNEDYSNVLYLSSGDIKLALIAVNQYYKLSNSDYNDFLFSTKHDALIKKKIDEARNNADWVILNYHGYEEYTYQPFPYKRQILKRYLQYGVDAIIGHHPHVIQGWEKINNKYIFYSLGNFIFDIPQHTMRPGTDSTILLNLHFTKEELKFDINVINIDRDSGTLSIVDDNIANKNFYEIIGNNDKEWKKDCHRLLFIDSDKMLSRNLDKSNPIIKYLKYYNRLFRLLKRYYHGKEAYRPILKAALAYKISNLFT